MLIYAINRPDADHLNAVTDEMLTLGAPTIRVVDCGDYYMALEGSHRLAAAHALGLVPELVILEQDEEIEPEDYDWCDDHRDVVTAGEAAGELFCPRSAVDYRFEVK